jgi:hypothetical protein
MYRKYLVAAMTAAMMGLSGAVTAAEFTYLGGGIHSQSDATAVNGAAVTDQPGVDVGWGMDFAESGQQASATGAGGGSVEIDVGGFGSLMLNGSSAMLDMSAWGSAWSDDANGHAFGYGNANTVQPAVTNGVLLQIIPGQGEAMGQAVRVDWSWAAWLDTTTAGAASVTGAYSDLGGDNRFGITLNDGNPASDPPVNWVWNHEVIEVSSGDGFDGDDNGFFMAHIGDIIGLHLGTDANMDLSGEGSDEAVDAFSTISLDVSAVPLPAALPLFLSALGLMGFAGNKRKKCH